MQCLVDVSGTPGTEESQKEGESGKEWMFGEETPERIGMKNLG